MHAELMPTDTMHVVFVYAETPTSIAARRRRQEATSREEFAAQEGAARRDLLRRFTAMPFPSGCVERRMSIEQQLRGGLHSFLIFRMEGRGLVSDRGLSDLRVDGDDGEPILHLRLAKRSRQDYGKI